METATDEQKMKNCDDRRRGEEAERKFLRGLKSELTERLQPGDPPCFILHNFACRMEGVAREVDVIVLHKTLCVLLVEVKAKDPPCKPQKFEKLAKKAVKQLNKAREMIKEKLGQQPIKAIVAFPNLTDDDRVKIEKVADFSKENEVTIVFGDSRESYQEILCQQPDHSFFSFTDCSDPILAFKFAVYRLTENLVRRPTFGQAVKMCAKQHEYCFLTEDQLQILDSDETLLHLYGPHGAGKSILLVLKAKKWIQKECKVIVLVGHENLDPLLQSLGKEIRSAPNKKGEVHVFRINELQEMLKVFETYSGKIFVIADEYAEHHKAIDDLIEQKKISAMWSAHVRPLPGNSRMQQRGLKQSIRCPPHVVDLLNQINPNEIVETFSKIPHHHLLNSEPSFICHDPEVPEHKNFRSYSECLECRTKMQNVFKEIGLLKSELLKTSTDEPADAKRPKKKKKMSCEYWEDLHWNDVLIIASGWIDDPKDVEAVEEWFLQLNVPAFWERPMEFKREGSIRLANDPAEMQPLSTNTQTQRSPPKAGGGQAERETKQLPPDGWRERVLKGVDLNDKPCVHFVHSLDFLGLEKYVVIMVHHDWRDLHEDHQTEERIQERLQEHREKWYRSVSRCLGKVIVLAATPSPLCRQLLQAGADH